MREIEYDNKEDLRKYVGKPIFLKRSDFLYTGELIEYSGESFWIARGPLLMAKSTFRERGGGENWHREYIILGEEYIPHSPYSSMAIPEKFDPDTKLFGFESNTEGRDIIEKIRKLEDIPPMV